MIPIGILVLGSIPWRWSRAAALPAIVVLGSLLGASLGLVLGTLVKPNRINIVFSLVFTPLLFTGLQPVPVALARHAALVPGRHRAEPDDLRQRGAARGARPGRPAHRAVDLPARPARGTPACCWRSACAGSTAARSTDTPRRLGITRRRLGCGRRPPGRGAAPPGRPAPSGASRDAFDPAPEQGLRRGLVRGARVRVPALRIPDDHVRAAADRLSRGRHRRSRAGARCRLADV